MFPEDLVGSLVESLDPLLPSPQFAHFLTSMFDIPNLQSPNPVPGLLTGFRSEVAEMVLNARLATEDPAGVSSATRRGG